MSGFSGHLQLRGAIRDSGRTVVSEQSFRAPFHVSKPYWDADAQTLLVQVVNPTAGILSGDRLQSEIFVDPGAALFVTTPSASRVFQMKEGEAECRQHFGVAAGAWLEVMPEPLVPHRGSRYRQFTSVDVAGSGTLFYVDQLMPGRIAHGETWSWDALCLGLEVRLEGRLILRERLEHSGDELRGLSALGGTGAAACFANAILITGEESAAASWRSEVAALHGSGLWIGVSALVQGGWSIKLIASDNVRLRAALRQMRKILAGSFPRLKCDPRKL